MFHSMGDSFAFFTSKNRSLYFVSCMLFFWALNDGIVTYITPLIIAQRGFSETTLGIIIGSSSIAGAIFDFFLSRYLRNTHFRRVYFFMFMLSACMPLLLFKATTTIMFLIAMALWGFYYDLQNFGNFDFVGRKSAKEEHSSHFGVITLFKAIGYMLAPIITSLLIGSFIDTKPFIVKTDYLQTKVLGTEFNVKSYTAEDSHVTLISGKVQVRSHENARFVDLEPGKYTTSATFSNAPRI